MHPTTSARALGWAALVSSACWGCVDKGSAPESPSGLCLAPVPAQPPWESVVLVESDLGEAGMVRCSGVAIAHTLVLTDVQCVALPSKLEPSELADPLSSLVGGAERTYQGDVDYSGSCRDDQGVWAPAEDGSFTTRLNDLVEPSAITVRVSVDGAIVASSRVLTLVLPRAESRCWDTPAVLVLEYDLGLPSATLSLEDTSQVGDAVTMSGFHLVDTRMLRWELPSRLSGITYESGDEVAPPRSLVVAEPICAFETGGPVVDDQSGALIGLIGFQTDFSCEDPAAPTIAPRLAPFRRMLLEAASSAAETLSVVPLVGPVDGPVHDCPALAE